MRLVRPAGVEASRLGKCCPGDTDRGGALIVNEFLNPGRSRSLSCGDPAPFERDGMRIPGVAHPALQIGTSCCRDDRGRRFGKSSYLIAIFRQRGYGSDGGRRYQKAVSRTLERLPGMSRVASDSFASSGGLIDTCRYRRLPLSALLPFLQLRKAQPVGRLGKESFSFQRQYVGVWSIGWHLRSRSCAVVAPDDRNLLILLRNLSFLGLAVPVGNSSA
jgi:hypothetical protein